VQQWSRLGSAASEAVRHGGDQQGGCHGQGGQQKKTKEVRKPKKEKPKTIAAAPSRGTVNDIKAR
jgi:hypothetical protein